MCIVTLCIKFIGPFLIDHRPPEAATRRKRDWGGIRVVSVQAVVLDANALLLPFQFRVNLEAELRRLVGDHEIFIPSPVMEELRGLSKSVREARGAQKLAERF